MITLSPTQSAWLAGFIDGEGFVGITFQRKKENKIQSASPQYHPYLIVTNKNRDSIFYIHKLVPEGKVYEFSPLSPVFQYKLSKREVLYSLLKELKLYLIVKRKQSELVLKFIDVRNSRKIATGSGSRGKTSFSLDEEKIYRQLLCLNKRGERIKNGITTF